MGNSKIEGKLTISGKIGGILSSHSEKAPKEPQRGWIESNKYTTNKIGLYNLVLTAIRKQEV